jgi:hypothetical protein
VVSGLYRDANLTGMPNPFNSVFFAIRVRNMHLNTRTRYIQGASDAGSVAFNMGGGTDGDAFGRSCGISSNSYLTFPPVFWQFSTGGFMGFEMQEDREYIVAFSANGQTGQMTTMFFDFSWHQGLVVTGGVEATIPPTYPSADMYADPSCTWKLCGANYGFNGEVAYIWYACEADTSAWVDLTTAANLEALKGNPEDWTFPSPLIWFQGDAAHWTSGANRGSGGDFYSNIPWRDAA